MNIFNKKFSFIILLSLDGAYAGNMDVTENMVFCEVVLNFYKVIYMKNENEPTFFYYKKQIRQIHAEY